MIGSATFHIYFRSKVWGQKVKNTVQSIVKHIVKLLKCNIFESCYYIYFEM